MQRFEIIASVARHVHHERRVGQAAERVEVIVCRNSELTKIVLALSPSRTFASRLNGWQQHRHQDTDDRDDHQQFYKRKTTPIE